MNLGRQNRLKLRFLDVFEKKEYLYKLYVPIFLDSCTIASQNAMTFASSFNQPPNSSAILTEYLFRDWLKDEVNVKFTLVQQ